MNKVRFYFQTVALVAIALPLAFTACGNDDYYDMPSDVVWRGAESAEGTIVTTPYDERIEVPARKEGNTFAAHTVQYDGHEVLNYCVEFDPVKMHSRWVAFRFDGDTRPRNVSRSAEPFQDDPNLPQSMWMGANAFGSPYDRGHLVASYDRLFCQEANEQTFYMSNMSPQLSEFNSPYWAKLERIVQNHGRNTSFADTLYVVKGGAIDKADDLLGYVNRSNGKRVAVPGHYFMALMRVKGTTYNAIGFWLEHENYGYADLNDIPNSTFEQRGQVKTIDQLEELTGIDFFHNLPDNIETEVEATYSISLWL